jgi:hypothetical protein
MMDQTLEEIEFSSEATDDCMSTPYSALKFLSSCGHVLGSTVERQAKVVRIVHDQIL